MNYFDSLLSDPLLWKILFHYLMNIFIWMLVQWTSKLCPFHISNISLQVQVYFNALLVLSLVCNNAFYAWYTHEIMIIVLVSTYSFIIGEGIFFPLNITTEIHLLNSTFDVLLRMIYKLGEKIAEVFIISRERWFLKRNIRFRNERDADYINRKATASVTVSSIWKQKNQEIIKKKK